MPGSTCAATKEIYETVEAMRASMIHVESGVASAHSAGEALTSIIHRQGLVQKMVTEIAAAVTQPSHSTQSVSTNVSEIASIIQHTAASSQQ
jgi:methyl-accepting chemotaxis protein